MSEAADFRTEKLGVYRIESRLGEGGMGEVFLAWDARLQRHVAVKRIRSDKDINDGARARFRREARAVARLSHPAIVQIFDILETDQGDCIVMEYVKGCGLRDAMIGGLSVRESLRIVREVAEGLTEAHRKGLVHRDLKPENVRLTEDGQVKILDFGLVRALWNDAVPTSIEKTASILTEEGALVGTIHAMAPEQASGRPVDHRADLFALGGLLYEMLTGKAPFRGGNLLTTLHRITSVEPEPLAQICPDLPRSLIDLVQRLLAKDPDLRPQNAALVAQEISGLLDDRNMTITPLISRQVVHGSATEDATLSLPGAPVVETAESAIRVLVLVEPLEDLSPEQTTRHDRTTRDLLARYDGMEAGKAGGGFLLLFERPADAVAVALIYQQSLRRLDLAARAAVHLGEVVLRKNLEDDVARGARPFEVEGESRSTATRILALASPCQTLLSRAVFDLARRASKMGELADPGLRWLAHGEYSFLGLEDALEICEVGLDGFAPLNVPADSETARRSVGFTAETTLGWRPATGQEVWRRPHWKLLERVGEGGFGEVWLTEHTSGERRIFKFCFDPERLKALKREVTLFRLMKDALGHRDDIARILDWNFEQAPFYLEAEYTEGGNLVDWADAQGGLSKTALETRLEIAAQIADALAAAHSVGVLHKDVKPENVLIASGGEDRARARLTDFGIGRLTDATALEDQAFTVTGFTTETEDSPSGTRLYMAPELLLSKPASVQADIYSFGVVLYQLIVGDFQSALAPGWRRDVEDELLREDLQLCVDGRPERRAGSMQEVARRLRTLQKRRGELAAERRAAEETEQVQRQLAAAQKKRRTMTAWAVGSTFVMLLVAFSALQIAQSRQDADQRRDQAEKLIDFMVGDLHQKLEPIGRTDILFDAGQAVAEYFAAVPEERLSDQELLKRSQALHQIGNINFQLGELDAATEAYRESLTLSDDLAKRDPTRDDRQFGLSQSHFWVGYMLFHQRDLDGAMKHFSAYQEISEELVRRDPTDDNRQLEVSYAHSNLASVYERRGDLDRAQKSLLQAEEVLTPLREKFAADLSVAKIKRGDVLRAAGELADALEVYEEVLEIRRKLHEEDESDTTKLRSLATAQYKLGELRRLRGEPALALKHFQHDLEMAQYLANQDPANVEWQRDVSMSREKVGRLYCQVGDFEMGNYFLNSGISTLQGILQLKENHWEWIINLTTLRTSAAWCAWREGRLDDALAEVRRALEHLARVPEDTEDRNLTLEQSRTFWLHGRILNDLGKTQDAYKSWIQGAEIAEPKFENPRSGSSEDLILLDLWVRNLHALGQEEVASSADERLRKMGFRDAENVEPSNLGGSR